MAHLREQIDMSDAPKNEQGRAGSRFPKSKGKSARSSSGALVVLGRASAKNFAEDMEYRAAMHRQWCGEAERKKDKKCASINGAVAAELAWTAVEFRRLTGLPNKRQPQHNTEV